MSQITLEQLIGSWVLLEAKTEFPDGTRADFYGASPTGFGVFTREGRMMAILTAASRSAADDEAGLAALVRSMTAYSGKFTLNGSELTVTVDAAWVPDLVGTQQKRHVHLDGDTLHLRSEKLTHPSYRGKELMGILTWRREIPV